MTTQEYRDEAKRLYFEDGTAEAIQKAKELFLKAAEDKDIESAVMLGGIAFDNNEYEETKKWWFKVFDWYKANPTDETTDYVSFAYAKFGDLLFYNYEEKDPVPESDRWAAYNFYIEALKMGNEDVRNELGLLYYEDNWFPGCTAEVNRALEMWKQGMENGDHRCALHYCAHFIDKDQVDQEIIDILEGLVRDEENPCADACALLYQYYSYIGNEDLATEWMECGLDMGSEMMEYMIAEEREQEVGEDDWTDSDDYEQEFEAYDDETEAPASATTSALCVIVVDTDGDFRIEHADASDRQSLPKIIDAERTDDMRCNKLQEVSKALRLKGTLLAKLDRDAFRKPDLDPNWHASQWYDGMADLYGDMIVCMEDNKYNPLSFSNEEEAQRVIDALRK